MQKRLFDLKINKNALVKQFDNAMVHIFEPRTTYIDYYEDEDENGSYIVPVIKYKIFDGYDDIYYGFSTKEGGVSKDYLYSLNFSFSRGDDIENVKTNHERFAKAVGYTTDTLVFSDQQHKANIKCVTKEDCGKGYTKESDIICIDGLVTNEKGVSLMTFYADCVPNFFYDPVNKVVGLAHSGWRGTALEIGTRMIETMQEKYGSKPENIICAIGPSICKGCYEVSKDVIDEFKKVFEKEQLDELATEKEDGKYMLDLHLACKYNLLKAGVKEENIALPDSCTCCNKDYLYSHRATNGKRGNLAAVIGIR